MQRRQSRAARQCAGFVVQPGENRQLLVGDADDAIGVAGSIPFALFVLVATDRTDAIVRLDGR